MVTRPNNFYDLITYGLGGKSFQQFVDKFALKYNNEQTEGFVWDKEIQIGETYEQLIATLGVATLPVYGDEASEGLDKALDKFEVGTNKIPWQKHRYQIDAKILRQKMLAVQEFGKAALSSNTQNALLDLLFDTTDRLLEGNVNARTHQRMQVVSTGKFTINTDNNPRGITGVTFDFNVPAANKESLSGDARWWTDSERATEGSDSDPLLFLKNKVKWMRKKGFPTMQLEMAQDLYDSFLMHSKVLKRVGLSLYPIGTDAQAQSYAANLSDDAKLAAIEKIIGCKVVVRDTWAYADKFNATKKIIEPTLVENFKVENVAFVPANITLGTIKSVKPMVLENDPTQRIAWFDGGRTLITNTFEAKTKSMYVNSEMAILCVPSMPQYMCICTVTA